ncbi:MAG: type I restriction enzyme HsdR N-terminal domain-containing protein [Bacteroidales bacterium]|nr:type I restriction enzyme HsdR N-terminal domain-containing protein [Bacteroidales bacterium]
MEWFKVTVIDNKTVVFDPLRKEYVALTPEEQVRQKMLHYLVETRKVPAGLIAVEYSIKVNNLPKRADIVVFNNLGEPQMIVECKAETVPITEKVLDQAIRYYSGLKVKYLTLTNGKSMFCYKIENGKLAVLTEFPIL